MTPSQRIIHRSIWYAYACILPLFAVLAIDAIPEQVTDQRSMIAEEPSGTVIAIAKDTTIEAKIVSARNKLHLLFSSGNIPDHAQTIVYLICPGRERIFAGALSNAEQPVFPLDTSAQWYQCVVELYDPFQETTFLTLRFEEQ